MTANLVGRDQVAGGNAGVGASLAGIAAGVLQGDDPLALAGVVLESAARATGAPRASIAHIEGERVAVEAVNQVGWTRETQQEPAYSRTHRRIDARAFLAHPLVREAVSRRAAVVGRGLDSDRADPDAEVLVVDLQHVAVAPFFGGESLLGAMIVARPREHPFSPAELNRLQEFANVAGLVFFSAHGRSESQAARVQARAAADRLRLALDAARDVAGVQDVEELTRRVLSRAARATGASHGVISQIVAGRLVPKYQLEGSRPRRGRAKSRPLDQVPGAVRALEARATVVAFPGRQAGSGRARNGPTGYALYCPLMAGGVVVGMLELGRTDHAFALDDVAVLDHFASVAALLLQSVRLLQEARAGADAKSRFLNLAAHELRTPLSVIRGYLSMIEDGTLPAPGPIRPIVEILRQKADELNGLVESMLLAARLETGNLDFQSKRIDVKEAVARAVSRQQQRLERAGGRIETKLPAGAVLATGDETALNRILDNLLGNALTYSEGPPEIAMTVEIAELEAAIIVRDHGSGIPEFEHSQLFQRFHRGARAIPHVGAGLGLAVSAELAAASGGSLTLLWSREGEGSAFRLALPLFSGGGAS